MRSLDLHGVAHADAADTVENFVLLHQDDLPLEIIYGNSEVMKQLVEGRLKKLAFSFNSGYQNPYGRLLVIGHA